MKGRKTMSLGLVLDRVDDEAATGLDQARADVVDRGDGDDEAIFARASALHLRARERVMKGRVVVVTFSKCLLEIWLKPEGLLNCDTVNGPLGLCFCCASIIVSTKAQ